MNDRPIIEKSANDFSIRISIRRERLANEIDTLKGQVALLCAQGIITPSSMELLLNQIKEIKKYTTEIESDYYDMRNTLETYEEEKKGRKNDD